MIDGKIIRPDGITIRTTSSIENGDSRIFTNLTLKGVRIDQASLDNVSGEYHIETQLGTNFRMLPQSGLYLSLIGQALGKAKHRRLRCGPSP
jgi:hypothetical protein